MGESTLSVGPLFFSLYQRIYGFEEFNGRLGSHQTITVPADSSNDYVMENDEWSLQVNLKKVDSETGKQIAGDALYEVYEWDTVTQQYIPYGGYNKYRVERNSDGTYSVVNDTEYAKDIEKAVKAYTDNGTEDLMKYFYESEYIKKHVLSLVPSVEVWNGRLYGCTTVRTDEDLSEPGWDKLMDYLSGQYSDGWGEGFEQREIETEDGLLYVHFWQDHDFNFTVEEITPSKKYEITDIEHPKDPSLHRIRALRRVSETVGPSTLGGYVQSEENLSQENDGAWIYGEAICCESAIVTKGGFLTDHARASGSALISGEAEIGGYARVRDRAIVTGGTVQENALVCGEAVVRKNVSTESVPLVEGHTTVMGTVAGAVYLAADAFILQGNTVDNPTNSVLSINGTHMRLYSIEQVKPPKAPER